MAFFREEELAEDVAGREVFVLAHLVVAEVVVRTRGLRGGWLCLVRVERADADVVFAFVDDERALVFAADEARVVAVGERDERLVRAVGDVPREERGADLAADGEERALGDAGARADREGRAGRRDVLADPLRDARALAFADAAPDDERAAFAATARRRGRRS